MTRDDYDTNRESTLGLVSVIIPTYNRAGELITTLESVRTQTYPLLEILICDDGSTDETERIVRDLMLLDPRIRYIHCGHNGRPAIPRNIGIRNATGEWYAFVDDDDVWLPSKIEKQIVETRKHGCQACCTNAYRIFDNKYDNNQYYFDGSKNKTYRFRDLVPVNPIICSSMMIHRSVIDRCIGFPEEKDLKAIEDYALWYRVCGFTDIYYLAEPLMGYTMSNTTSIRKDRDCTFELVKETIEIDFQNWLKDQEQGVQEYYRKELIIASVQKYTNRVKILFVVLINRIRKTLKY